jgi:hypothetical protein
VSYDELAEAVRDELGKAYLYGVVSVTHGSDPRGVPLGYPESAPAEARLLAAAEAWAATRDVEANDE